MAPLSSTSDLILASTSPRRRELLQNTGLDFSVIPSRFDESRVRKERADHYALASAQGKARAVGGDYPSHWVLGADTVVVVDEKIFGKPVSSRDARQMLTQLSGRQHRVITAFALQCHQQNMFYQEIVSTDVYFKPLGRAEIDGYIASGEPFDKAGAYAIQGMGAFMVCRINGSYTNVVGLPLAEVMTAMNRVGVRAVRPEKRISACV